MKHIEMVCNCKNCLHWESKNGTLGYCYYWKYEQGESPNMTTEIDFCSNAEEK